MATYMTPVLFCHALVRYFVVFDITDTFAHVTRLLFKGTCSFHTIFSVKDHDLTLIPFSVYVARVSSFNYISVIRWLCAGN